jgi:L-asparaginase II
MATSLAEIIRGSVTESVHFGHVAVVDATGQVVAGAGDTGTEIFFRSSAKPFQALPLVVSGAADAFGFTSEELALACASHNGTERHQSIVSSMLDKAGLEEDDLRCGHRLPLDETEKARIVLGQKPATQVQCECSGKHAGMLAVCKHLGWPLDGYLEPDHPLQVEIRSIVAGACDVPDESFVLATDGCSLPTFGAPLDAFARAYAKLADPRAGWGDPDPESRNALDRLREAIGRHPELVSGDGEIDTVIMQETSGRVIAKLGAEGLLCMAIPGHRLGIAITAIDGFERSLGPAALAALEQLEVLDSPVLASLREQLCPPIETFTGTPVGETRPVLVLERFSSLRLLGAPVSL